MTLIQCVGSKGSIMAMLVLGILMVASGGVYASDSSALQVTNVQFIKEITPKIGMSIHNSEDKAVTAWRGRLVCLDAFGDHVINISAISRSANIDPGSEQYFERRLDAQTGDSDRREVAQAAVIVLENDAKNFDCNLADLEVIY